MCGVYEKVQHSLDVVGWRRIHTQKCGQVRLTLELMYTCGPLSLLGGRDLRCTLSEIVGLYFLNLLPLIDLHEDPHVAYKAACILLHL